MSYKASATDFFLNVLSSVNLLNKRLCPLTAQERASIYFCNAKESIEGSSSEGHSFVKIVLWLFACEHATCEVWVSSEKQYLLTTCFITTTLVCLLSYLCLVLE